MVYGLHRLSRIAAIASLGVLALLAGCAGSPAGSSTPAPVRYAEVNGARLAYVDQGSGMPVVFLHGAIGDLRYWEPWRESVAVIDNAHSMAPMFSSDPPPPVTCEQLQRFPGRVVEARGERTRTLFRIQHDAVLRCLSNGTELVAPQGKHSWPGTDPERFRRELLAFLTTL